MSCVLGTQNGPSLLPEALDEVLDEHGPAEPVETDPVLFRTLPEIDELPLRRSTVAPEDLQLGLAARSAQKGFPEV